MLQGTKTHWNGKGLRQNFVKKSENVGTAMPQGTFYHEQCTFTLHAIRVNPLMMMFIIPSLSLSYVKQ